jgi:hypothetical protein
MGFRPSSATPPSDGEPVGSTLLPLGGATTEAGGSRGLQGLTQARDRIASREASGAHGVSDLIRIPESEEQGEPWVMNFPREPPSVTAQRLKLPLQVPPVQTGAKQVVGVGRESRRRRAGHPCGRSHGPSGFPPGSCRYHYCCTDHRQVPLDSFHLKTLRSLSGFQDSLAFVQSSLPQNS